MEKKKILVTGCMGFIGSQLCARLEKDGHSVVGMENFNRHLYHHNLKVLRGKLHNVDMYARDIRSQMVLLGILQQNKDIDYVIHLAAHAGVRDSFGKENEYHSNNIDGTQILIDSIKKINPDIKVIYASTSSVYGGTPMPEGGWVEEDVRGHQLNAYAYTKFVNECQFKVSGLQNVGLRFFTVYGPWGRPDMALFRFTRNILDEKSISLYNHGYMRRDFTYIDDILDGIQIVMKNFDKGDIQSNEIFNIGRGEQVELTEFVSAIEECCDKKAIVEYADKHPADTTETWSNIDKLKKYGYQPQTSIGEGVKNFYKWYIDYTRKHGEV